MSLKEKQSTFSCIKEKAKDVKNNLSIRAYTLLAVGFLGLAAMKNVEANSNFTLGYERRILEGEDKTNLDIYASTKLNKKLGVSGYYFLNKNYAEGYIGPTYNPTSWSEIGISLGIETNDKPIRSAASVWVGKGRHSLSGAVETGGTGKWYSINYEAVIAKGLKAGLIFKRFLGIGPQISVNIPKTPVNITGGVTYDQEAKKIKGFVKTTARF